MLTLLQDAKFYDDLFTHGYSNPKTQEVGLACALDLCRAASYVNSADDVPLRMLAYDVAHEIKVSLLLRERGSLSHLVPEQAGHLRCERGNRRCAVRGGPGGHVSVPTRRGFYTSLSQVLRA